MALLVYMIMIAMIGLAAALMVARELGLRG